MKSISGVYSWAKSRLTRKSGLWSFLTSLPLDLSRTVNNYYGLGGMMTLASDAQKKKTNPEEAVFRFKELWRRNDGHFSDGFNLWKQAVGSINDFDRYNLYKKEIGGHKTFNYIQGEISVYRGVFDKENIEYFSWTLEPKLALEFASRKDGFVVCGKLHSKDISFCLIDIGDYVSGVEVVVRDLGLVHDIRHYRD